MNAVISAHRASYAILATAIALGATGCAFKKLGPEIVLWAISNKPWNEVADCLNAALTTRRGFAASEVVLTKDASSKRAVILVQGSEDPPIVSFTIFETPPETRIEYRKSANERQAAVMASRSLFDCDLWVAVID